MPAPLVGLFARALVVAAAKALAKAAKSPAVRRVAVKAAQKAKDVFKKGIEKAKQLCNKVKKKLRRRPKGKFADQNKLQDHYKRHGKDFGARSPAEYEAQADRFLNGSMRQRTLEKVRPNGDIVRYNPSTQEFGVVRPDSTIRTYYRPDPAVHGRPTNLDYFNAQ